MILLLIELELELTRRLIDCAGAERQEEAGDERRQLREGVHRRVRQLPVPLQLHRLPGPRQAEGLITFITFTNSTLFVLSKTKLRLGCITSDTKLFFYGTEDSTT